MKVESKRIVLCAGARTPIGHLAKSLAPLLPEELFRIAIDNVIQRTPLYPHAVDGVVAGWVGQGSHAPNIARIAVLKSNLPEKAHAFTVQANCVSGLEAVCAAARHIIMREGFLYLAGGTESMSNMPYAIRGHRGLKELRSLDAVKENWSKLFENKDIQLTDCIEEGLNDPVKMVNMAGTAEICAQMYSISRAEQDAYAHETYKRALTAEKNGFYESHTIPLKHADVVLDKDEYPFLRESLVEKPQMLGKAPSLFNSAGYTMEQFYKDYGDYILGKTYQEGKSQATVTLFNSCARSDGAAVLIVTSDEKARELNLEILGEIRSWAYWGNNPAHMGISPVFATALALERAGIKFKDLDQIELHEAFAATCLSIFKVGKEKYNQYWEEKWKEGKLNPNGGSMALGHPLAATGTRILLNLLYSMKVNPKINMGLVTACAAGGLGGAMVIERYKAKSSH